MKAADYAAEKCLLRSTGMFEIRNILHSTPKASTGKNNLCSCQGGWSLLSLVKDTTFSDYLLVLLSLCS